MPPQHPTRHKDASLPFLVIFHMEMLHSWVQSICRRDPSNHSVQPSHFTGGKTETLKGQGTDPNQWYRSILEPSPPDWVEGFIHYPVLHCTDPLKVTHKARYQRNRMSSLYLFSFYCINNTGIGTKTFKKFPAVFQELNICQAGEKTPGTCNSNSERRFVMTGPGTCSRRQRREQSDVTEDFFPTWSGTMLEPHKIDRLNRRTTARMERTFKQRFQQEQSLGV